MSPENVWERLQLSVNNTDLVVKADPKATMWGLSLSLPLFHSAIKKGPKKIVLKNKQLLWLLTGKT